MTVATVTAPSDEVIMEGYSEYDWAVARHEAAHAIVAEGVGVRVAVVHMGACDLRCQPTDDLLLLGACHLEEGCRGTLVDAIAIGMAGYIGNAEEHREWITGGDLMEVRLLVERRGGGEEHQKSGLLRAHEVLGRWESAWVVTVARLLEARRLDGVTVREIMATWPQSEEPWEKINALPE